MKLTAQEYARRVQRAGPHSPLGTACLWAGGVGGGRFAPAQAMTRGMALVPITGVANAVGSAAIEFKTEGRVLGTGAKMFTIAGPVIVYGTLAAVLYGGVLWLLGS